MVRQAIKNLEKFRKNTGLSLTCKVVGLVLVLIVLIVSLSPLVQSGLQHQNLPLDVSDPHQKEKALALYVSVTKFLKRY